MGTAQSTVSYGYNDAAWSDLLTSYNGQSFTYDTIGNPLQWRDGMTLSWQNGRQLSTLQKSGLSASYSYDEQGIRIAKTANGVTTAYYTAGSVLLGESRSDGTEILYYYDENGAPFALQYNGVYYHYLRNIQGDIVGLLNAQGNVVAQYTYDAWGKLLSVTNASGTSITDPTHVGNINPLRYRGYYYDTDSGLYYLQTRYYDPEVGRFLNADGQLNNDILGTNLFAYCGNNPIIRADDTGRGWWVIAGALIGGIAGGITKIVSNVVTGKKWNDGVIGATVGGAVYGGVLAATGNVWIAGFESAAVESLTNEVISYIPKVSQANGQTVTKKLTTENVIDSTKTVLNDTVVNGVIIAGTGRIAGKIVVTNNGWFQPQKFATAFIGKYAIKSELQTLIQSGLLFGVEVFKYLINQRLQKGQRPIVTFFPNTEIRVVG